MKNIKSIIKKIWRNKVFRTFLQTFIATFAGGYAIGLDDKGLYALFISSLSAAICAIMNVGKYESY